MTRRASLEKRVVSDPDRALRIEIAILRERVQALEKLCGRADKVMHAIGYEAEMCAVELKKAGRGERIEGEA